MTVGVLALQGGFAAHELALRELGLSTRQVRQPADLAGLAGLVLPGGESTTMLELLTRTGLWAPLRRFAKPVLATCAGAILAARRVEPAQPCLGWLDLGAVRNAWGRQVHSFTAESDRGRPLVFIRAPRLIDLGPLVEVVETYDGEPVCVRQGNVTAATFHPELTPDRSLHRAVFLSEVVGSAHADVNLTNKEPYSLLREVEGLYYYALRQDV